jgi:hypothetical protein
MSGSQKQFKPFVFKTQPVLNFQMKYFFMLFLQQRKMFKPRETLEFTRTGPSWHAQFHPFQASITVQQAGNDADQGQYSISRPMWINR